MLGAVFTVMPVTVTGATVTVQVASKLPSSVFTVMVAVPADSGVTTPFATVATVSLLDDHVTFLLAALAGVTVATKVSVAPPATSDNVPWSKLTPVTGTSSNMALMVTPPTGMVNLLSVMVIRLPLVCSHALNL